MPGGTALAGPPATEPMSEAYDALKRLYDRNAKGLLAFFQRRVDDPELAVDLMADTFTLALERHEQFRGMGEKQLSGWLWSIAQSVLREHERRDEVALRNARRLGRDRRALTDREIERIEELASSENLRAAVARSLDKLPPDQREAVRLRVVDGLSYKEIADRLGITASGTRTRVTRAMRELRTMLKRDFEREEGECP